MLGILRLKGNTANRQSYMVTWFGAGRVFGRSYSHVRYVVNQKIILEGITIGATTFILTKSIAKILNFFFGFALFLFFPLFYIVIIYEGKDPQHK